MNETTAMNIRLSLARPFAKQCGRATAVVVVAAVLASAAGMGSAPSSAQRAPDERDFRPPSSNEGRPLQRAPRERDAPGGKVASGDKDAPAAKAEPKPIPSRIGRPGSVGVPDGGAERAKLLSELFAHLATAPDETVANRVAAAIEHVWRTSTSDTVSLLIDRSVRASKEKSHELAVRLLDRAAQIAPDNGAVFKTRAAVNYARDDIHGAVGDLRRALALEPNDFKALEMLGGIFKELGRKRAAFEVYRKLYDVHPQMQGIKLLVDELERDAIGQPG